MRFRPRRGWWLLAGLAAVLVTAGGAVAVSGPAGAHAFLVATTPAQGERLDAAPPALVLKFSEAPEASSLRVELAPVDGDRVDLPAPEVTGLDARTPVGDLADGVYVASWGATSAVDGHESAGEFAFAVGDVQGAIPVARSESSTSGSGLAASVLFVAGLALASGALVLRAVVGSDDPAPGVGVARAGLLVATGGAVVALVATDGGVWAPLATIVPLQVALLLVALRRGWVAPLVATVAAAGAWAARSHGAADHGVVGWLVDFVHLGVGAAWGGSLVLVAVAGWRLRRRGRPWLAVVRRYSRLALWLVVALGVAGVVSAVQLVPSWADLWDTGYGRLVVVKAALFALALVAATVARLWGLRREAVTGVRSLMTGEVLAVAAAMVVAGLLASGAPPLSATSTEQLLGSPPLGGDVARDAGLAGQLNVAVASDGRRLDVDVFGSSGPLPGTEVGVTVERPDGSPVDLEPRPCGPGCYTQALELTGGVTTVRVAASATEWTGGYYEAELRWPPGRLDPERLAQVVARMRQVPRLEVTETTTSGPGSTASPHGFTLSGDQFIDTVPYAGANVDDVRLVGDRRLTLYLPGDEIYAELDLDDAGRLARSRMVTRGHEITHEFGYPPGPG